MAVGERCAATPSAYRRLPQHFTPPSRTTQLVVSWRLSRSTTPSPVLTGVADSSVVELFPS